MPGKVFSGFISCRSKITDPCGGCTFLAQIFGQIVVFPQSQHTQEFFKWKILLQPDKNIQYFTA